MQNLRRIENDVWLGKHTDGIRRGKRKSGMCLWEIDIYVRNIANIYEQFYFLYSICIII